MKQYEIHIIKNQLQSINLTQHVFHSVFFIFISCWFGSLRGICFLLLFLPLLDRLVLIYNLLPQKNKQISLENVKKGRHFRLEEGSFQNSLKFIVKLFVHRIVYPGHVMNIYLWLVGGCGGDGRGPKDDTEILILHCQ